MPNLNEVLGVAGVYETLQALERSSLTSLPAPDVVRMMDDFGASDANSLLENLVAFNVIHRSGDRLSMTRQGIRACLLLQAINGGDVKDIYRRLAQLDSDLRMYELMREGMTKAFLRSISSRPGFVRLYVCSPWINLDRKQAELLLHGVTAAERSRGERPEVLVITRPEDKTDDVIPATLKPFQDLGATIFLTKRLHTKLYIREPGRSGGYFMGIVGSQNLTRSRYIELGIRINGDAQMINQLIRHFLEITHDCHEAK